MGLYWSRSSTRTLDSYVLYWPKWCLSLNTISWCPAASAALSTQLTGILFLIAPFNTSINVTDIKASVWVQAKETRQACKHHRAHLSIYACLHNTHVHIFHRWIFPNVPVSTDGAMPRWFPWQLALIFAGCREKFLQNHPHRCKLPQQRTDGGHLAKVSVSESYQS